MLAAQLCCLQRLLSCTPTAVAPHVLNAVCTIIPSALYSAEAELRPDAALSEGQHENDEGTFSSLSGAARRPEAVRRLDLAASPQLLCANLLCDKVGDPCICRISRLFEQLNAVEELSLRGNSLTELPPSTWHLTSLRGLDLSDNKLTALPADISSLQQLQVLKLTGNSPQLQLPFAALTQLSQLQELYVDQGIRQQMIRTPEAAPLLHQLQF